MVELIKYAFENTNTNKFWLDVYPDNHIGINLYESLGMTFLLKYVILFLFIISLTYIYL